MAGRRKRTNFIHRGRTRAAPRVAISSAPTRQHPAAVTRFDVDIENNASLA